MEKLVITGGKKLTGTIAVSGAKNVALKALVASALTQEAVIIHNIPHISDFYVLADILKDLGGSIEIKGHTATVIITNFSKTTIPLEKAALARASVLFIAPLLARCGVAKIPNPGGCRLGARPVDRTIDGLTHMGVSIDYDSSDGYFHAKSQSSGQFLTGTTYTFNKNTHTGTETLLLAAVLAKGKTVLINAAEEPEIDELIAMLNNMGAQIQRSGKREITIVGVEKLHGTEITILPDRNEIVTFAIAALVTKGDVSVKGAEKVNIDEFLAAVDMAGGKYERLSDGIRFYNGGTLVGTDITTSIYPGFMTDWQAPWAILMTQAQGKSTVHETVFENKFGYVKDLKKMGAQVRLFNPKVESKETVYNFNLADDDPSFFHAIEIAGPTPLHEAVLTTVDIRAGAAIVLAALAAKGTSTIFGVEKLDRGYEKFDKRLASLGADIQRMEEKD